MEIIISLIAAIIIVLILTGIVVGLTILLESSYLAGIIGFITFFILCVWIIMYSEIFLQ